MEKTTKQRSGLELGPKFRRKTWLLPLYLSLAVFAGYLAGLVWLAFSPDEVSFRTVADAIFGGFMGAASCWVVDLPFVYIPFSILGWVGGRRTYVPESDYYAANGVLLGLSLVTVLFGFLVGLGCGDRGVEPGGAAQANALLLVFIAPVMGFIAMLVGGLLGLCYGFYRQQSEIPTSLHRPNHYFPWMNGLISAGRALGEAVKANPSGCLTTMAFMVIAVVMLWWLFSFI